MSPRLPASAPPPPQTCASTTFAQVTLATAIRSAMGIQTLIRLVDIASYSREQATETVKGTVRALLHAAISASADPR
jgi:hypothetical protein